MSVPEDKLAIGWVAMVGIWTLVVLPLIYLPERSLLTWITNAR
jgi:hypothetical protein